MEDDIRITDDPKLAKAIKGNKDDIKDSKWIGDPFACWFHEAIFSKKQSVFFMNISVIIRNLFPAKAVKRIFFKILSLFVI